MEFERRRPSPEALRWVERSFGPGHKVVGWRRLTGGISSAVHRLSIERRRRRHSTVLRQYRGDGDSIGKVLNREVTALQSLPALVDGVAVPRVLAACIDGTSAGRPSLLMTRVPGRVWLTPTDSTAWLRQIARAAAAIHALPVVPGAAPPFESWLHNRELHPPASSSRPDLWRAAFAAARDGGVPEAAFRHGDFQHFNMLWSRGRLSAVVDWTCPGAGPQSVDIGHCRLNLAVLFAAEWSEQFREMYEAEAGRAVDPRWDLHALLSYGDGWMRFIPIQVDGRAPVDTAGMTRRVEAVVESTLKRIDA